MSLSFAYRARTPAGERVTGTIRALDRTAALAALRRRLLVPTYVAVSGRRPSLARLLRPIGMRERTAFYRAFAALDAAGVDLASAFDLLLAHARGRALREALDAVRADVVSGGERLFEAMARRPDDFSDLEVAMVAAGDEAGDRAGVFDRLAALLERDERLRRRLSAALAYPALVVVAAACVVAFLAISVVPQFARLFDAFGVPRSPVLAVMIAAASLAGDARAYALALPCAALAAFAGARALATPAGALAADRVRLRLPLAGDAATKTTTARVSRVLATLMQAGVNHLRSLELAAPVAQSPVFAAALHEARERLRSGRAATLDEALAASGAFPALALGFVRVGSRTGDVPAMLLRAAAYYEDDVEGVLSALPTVVQTAVTLALGIVVALVVYVVYVPLTSLAASIR